MKECINCKAMLADDELFCHECGAKQEMVVTVVQVEEEQELEGNKCIYCGETIEEDSAFCPFCGKPQAEKPHPIPEPEPVKEKSELKTEQAVEIEPQEETHYEWKEEKKFKTWLWILLAVLVAGGIGMWYYMSDENSNSDSLTIPEVVDSTPIEESEGYEQKVPTNPLAFLNQFYMGDLNNAEYIKEHVTANVLNKLKRDYKIYCPSGDCVATWVFTAYPPGSDLELEEGPIITESEDGRYSVLYQYYSYGQSGRIYKPRGLLFSVTQIDGKYMISDYELVMPDVVQNPSDLSDGINGQYYLRDGRMFLHIVKDGPEIEADFNFRDGTYVSATYYFSCILDDENKFSSFVQKSNGKNSGKIEGSFEGDVLKVDARVDNQYSGSYEFKLDDKDN